MREAKRDAESSLFCSTRRHFLVKEVAQRERHSAEHLGQEESLRAAVEHCRSCSEMLCLCLQLPHLLPRRAAAQSSRFRGSGRWFAERSRRLRRGSARLADAAGRNGPEQCRLRRQACARSRRAADVSMADGFEVLRCRATNARSRVDRDASSPQLGSFVSTLDTPPVS